MTEQLSPRIPLHRMLEDMMKQEASDLYLCANTQPRLSQQGQFIVYHEHQLAPEETDYYANQLMSDKDKRLFTEEHEANVSYVVEGKGRFRVNVFVQRNTTAIVIRRITTDIPNLQQLSLPPLLGELSNKARGMILVTGATGSGKSTTLAAMIDHRNQTHGGHIITIEDPVEFIHTHKKAIISQREVGIDTKSFHAALKNSLRQAPEVIYIGEIRDTETMGFALHASETGHLVLGTLHSNNANQTLERISNFFPHDFQDQLRLQLSLNLRSIISQRLVKKINGGRVAAMEILLDTPTVRELVLKGEIRMIKTAMMNARNEGMQTFDMHLHELWKQGLITEEEAFRNADSANNLRLQMKGVATAAT
ncbi:MAG: PilT/PilU family type 4a pilus ATPase [Sumerlaeia bacterium]